MFGNSVREISNVGYGRLVQGAFAGALMATSLIMSSSAALAAAARVSSVLPSSGPAGTMVVVTVNAGCASSGSVIFGTTEVAATVGTNADSYVTLTAVAPAGTRTVDVLGKFSTCGTPS